MLAHCAKLIEELASRVQLCEVVLYWFGRQRDVICECTHGIWICQSSCVNAVEELSAQRCH